MKDSAKYIRLYEQLKNGIAQGVYPAGGKLPGENELAGQWDMSRQTVRQALSLLEREGLIQRRQGSGTYVKESRLRQRSGNVGIIATYISEYIFPSILRGIEGELSENGFSALLSATKNRVDSERRILEDYISKPIDGLIVEGTKSALPNPNLLLYEKLRDMGIPVVFFNGYYPAMPGCVSVTVNDRKGGEEAVQYLLKQGHRKIGGIFKSDDMQGLERYAGYLQGISKGRLPMRDDWTIWFNSENRSRLFSGEQEIGMLLGQLSECTAVLCYNDEVAVKLTSAMRAHGIGVPRDKAVLSFDNSMLSEIGPVRLTSLDHPKERLGVCAARKLISMMDGNMEKSAVLDWGFVKRESA